MSSDGNQPTPSPSTSTAKVPEEHPDHDLQALTKEAENTSLKLESITDGSNENGVPKVKFVEDIDAFSNTFNPPASAELMIGAYSDLFGKFKTYEGSLVQRSEFLEILIFVFFEFFKIATLAVIL
jgi:hypothetical protein